jgi:predicted ATPase
MTGERCRRRSFSRDSGFFFERLAGSHPVVVLVEDGECADAGLLDFLEYLVDWVRELPVFVLVFARPSWPGPGRAWASGATGPR